MAYRPKDTEERILHRLKIARGHLEKVIKMIEDGSYCIDVLHQSMAVQNAIKEVDSLILRNHLENCVAKDIGKGKTKNAVDEVMKVFEKIK